MASFVVPEIVADEAKEYGDRLREEADYFRNGFTHGVRFHQVMDRFKDHLRLGRPRGQMSAALGGPPVRRVAMSQASEGLTTSSAARPPLSPIDPVQFQRRLTVATLGLLLAVLLGFVLYVCASILQPLFIAGLLLYMIIPLHQRLVSWRVPSPLAYLLIVLLVLGLFWGVGQMAYRNFAELSGPRLNVYEERLDRLARKALRGLPF